MTKVLLVGLLCFLVSCDKGITPEVYKRAENACKALGGLKTAHDRPFMKSAANCQDGSVVFFIAPK